jgi:hypothetical protein
MVLLSFYMDVATEKHGQMIVVTKCDVMVHTMLLWGIASIAIQAVSALNLNMFDSFISSAH